MYIWMSGYAWIEDESIFLVFFNDTLKHKKSLVELLRDD